MANHKSAMKRIRQTVRRNDRNTAVRSTLRSQLKQFHAAVAAGEKDGVAKLVGPTVSMVDRAAQRGVIHRNKAARVKSALAGAVAGLSSAQ